MDKAFWNTWVTPTWASLEAGQPHSRGCTSAFQFRAGEHQWLFAPRNETGGSQKKAQTPPPQHQMPHSTDPLLRSSLPEDAHTAGAGKRCPDAINRAASLLPRAPLHLHTSSPSSPTPAPRGHGTRSFPRSLLIQHKQLSVNSICSPSPRHRLALGGGTSWP